MPTGQPRSTCEREQWYELAPARVRATGMEAGFNYNTHYSQLWEGYGVFRTSENDPEDIEDLWPAMEEPELQERHQAWIDPVDDAHRSSFYWSLGGLAGLFGGLGIAVAVSDQSGGAAAAAGITGVVAGLVGAIGALVAQPSGIDQLNADARRKLFIPGEDDMNAVARGIDRVNGKRRHGCGGPPPEPYVPVEEGRAVGEGSAVKQAPAVEEAPAVAVPPTASEPTEPTPGPDPSPDVSASPPASPAEEPDGQSVTVQGG